MGLSDIFLSVPKSFLRLFKSLNIHIQILQTCLLNLLNELVQRI